MDSATPDPQQQQQPPPPQQQAPSAPQPQTQPLQQPQSQQPHQQPKPQPQPTHIAHQQAQAPFSHAPIQTYSASYYRYNAQPQYAYHQQAYPSYTYTAAPWAHPPNYPIQPIPNIAASQPPHTNVPQQHNKPSSQLIGPVMNATDNRTHTQHTTPVSKQPSSRPRILATLKDPTTNKEVPLPNTTTTTNSPAQALLQKVSEDGLETASPKITATATIASAPTTTSTTTTNTTAGTTQSTPATITTPTASSATTTATTTSKTSPTPVKTPASPAKTQSNPAKTAGPVTVPTTGTSVARESNVSQSKVSATDVTSPTKSAQVTGAAAASSAPVSKTATVSGQTSSTSPATESSAGPKPTTTDSHVSNAKSNEIKIARTTTTTNTTTTTTTTTTTKTNEDTTKQVDNSSTREEVSIPNEEKVAKADATIQKPSEQIESADATTNEISKDHSNGDVVQDDKKLVTTNDDSVETEKQSEVKAEADETDGKEESDGSKKEQEDGDERKESEPEKSLTYETWQYNPLSNRSGRKVYSKEFLLDVCRLVCKLDMSLKDGDDKMGIDGNRLSSAFSEKIDIFAPAFSNRGYTPANRQNDQNRRPNQHNYAGRSSAGQERQRKVIASASLTQEVELKTTSNPWRPGKEAKEDVPVDVAETELLKKKFRSILNKLTPNNFESLSRSVTDLNIDTESKLGDVIDIVFAKALSEPGYCVLYGQMCSHLKKKTAETANFGNTLLKRCQNQFLADIYQDLNVEEKKEKIENEQDPDIKKQLSEELYEVMYRCRMRGLGLIKFIGELYKIEMLNDMIMFDCVVRLLADTSEESLECLCDLLVTIGEKLDRSTQKNAEREKKHPKSASKANAYQGGQRSAAAIVASGPAQKVEQPTILHTLDQVFERLHKIRKDKDLPLSVRIRFKLLDTCELREKFNWQSSKTKDNNPKKIEEIREAHQQKLEQERKQNAMGPRRSQEGGRRGLGYSSGSSSQISSMANDSSINKGSMHTSASSHLLRDQSVGDNIKTDRQVITHQKKIENYKSAISNKPKNEGTQLIPQSFGSLRPYTAKQSQQKTTSTTPASST